MKSSQRRSLCASVFLLVMLLGGAAVFAGEESAGNEKDARIVWVQQEGSLYPVFFAQRVAGEWQEPVILTDNENLNLVPSVAVSGGVTWVVWTVFDKGDSSLYMKRLIGTKWTEAEKIETGLDTNMAPSLAFDNDGRLWLAWSGGDGQDDEIFYSSWNGSAFETADRLTDNGVPDVLPVFGVTGKGTLWIQWKYYSPSGYVTKTSEWSGKEWSEAKTADDNSFLLNLESDGSSGSDDDSFILPEFVENPDGAALSIGGQEIQSLPIRMLSVLPGINSGLLK